MISKTNFYFALLKKLLQIVKMSWKKFLHFLIHEGLPWNKLRRICINGVPAMLGSRSGFQTKVKAKSP